jgi:hypothetical protein
MVLRKVKMKNCNLQGICHQTNPKLIQNHGCKIFAIINLNYKHGNLGEI